MITQTAAHIKRSCERHDVVEKYRLTRLSHGISVVVRRLGLLFVCCFFSFSIISAQQGQWGRFSGPLRVQFDPDGRHVVLLENFVYIDPAGKLWGAPTGSRVDGASIPQAFWSIIGGPFAGRYREASVIHDVACVNRTKSWEDTHRAFYNAMRCSGVGERRAKIMYFAVYHFGPRWGLGAVVKSFFSPDKPATAADVDRAKEFVEKNNPSLEEIERAKN